MGDFVRVFVVCLIAAPLLSQMGFHAMFESPDVRKGVTQLLLVGGLFFLMAKGLALLASRDSAPDKNSDDELPR